ncbi:MAG: amidohydrolase [Pseudomonadales bacterium]
MTRRAALFLALALAGCDREEAPAQEPVDLLLYNGTVLVLDEVGTQASAMAVRGDRIIAVGDDSLRERFDPDEALDLGGKTIMPGFVDSHIHVSGSPQRYVDLTNITSITHLTERIADKAKALGPGEWITGYGWSEDQLEVGRRPERADLDAAAPDNPVVLTRAGGHSAVVSSLALMLAEIDEKTPQPEGGVIEKGADGKLNGIIRERQALVTDLVPRSTAEELRPSHIAHLQALFAKGITSIIQAQDTIEHYPEWEAIYTAYRGNLPRAAVQLTWEGDAAMAAFGRRSGDGDEHLRIGAIKVFVDGGFSGPAAYTRKPYRGMGEYRGSLSLPAAEIHDILRSAHRDGWQLGVHAIGDAAIDLAVESLADVITETPRADHRHYLNHFTLMPDTETLAQMVRQGIAITQQPNFTYTLEGRYLTYLEGDTLETNNPLRTPMNHGIHVALSSDILPIGPVVGLYAAVTRKGQSGRVFGAAERIAMIDALRGYTIRGAWLTREETSKGTLEAGKLADFIVLSGNPLRVSESEILDLQVEQTWLGGRKVYSAPITQETDA